METEKKGTPLKDRRSSVLQQTQATGHYGGLEGLRQHDEDPIRFERFEGKLFRACNAALETVKSVAASPAAREMGELVLALTTPEGHVVTASMGLAAHVGTIPYMIGWMLEHDYEENPRFQDGDIFATNDPRAGCAHPADCYTFVPIFHQGEVVAWAAAITHILDAGHPFVGSIPSYAPNTFFDGFLYPPMKVGQEFIYQQWFDWLWRRRTRTPDFNILDEKARGAGCLLIRQKILEIIEEFGLDYFQEALSEMIELGRRRAQEVYQAVMVPGRYRAVCFSPILYKGYMPMFPESDKNWLLHLPQTLHVLPGGRMRLEHEGLASWDWFHVNAGESIATALYYMGLVAYMAYDIGYNSGIILQLDWDIPEGSIFKVDHPFASVAFTWLPAISMLPLFNQNLVRNFFLRGYLEECVDGDFSISLAQGAGILEDGKTWGWSDFEYAGASGRGAHAYMDGVPQNWSAVSPMADCGNMEEWEYVTPPLFYLGRRLLSDYLGHGKYRGSPPAQSTWMVLRPGRHMSVGGLTLGNPFFPPSVAHFGGYPQPGAYIAVARGTNLLDLIRQGAPLPRDFQEVLAWVREGRLKADKILINPGHGLMDEELKEGDILAATGSGGAGWGDPLERDPQRVLRDLEEGWVSEPVAREVYGVAFHGQGSQGAGEQEGRGAGEQGSQGEKGAQLDLEGTTRQREQLQQDRLRRARPFQEWWQDERDRLRDGELIPEIQALYRDAFRSPAFRQEFLGFWQLGDTFEP